LHNWNGDLANPDKSEAECEADDEYNIEPCGGTNVTESPEHRVVGAAPTVPGLIWPTLKSMKQAEEGLATLSTMETRRNKGNKKM
jgi:hypothetical protein